MTGSEARLAGRDNQMDLHTDRCIDRQMESLSVLKYFVPWRGRWSKREKEIERKKKKRERKRIGKNQSPKA